MEKRSPDNGSPVTQIRIARPTDRLAEVVGFYRDALGLEQIDSFEGHAGYDGVMLALPGRRDHLEFTHHESGSPCPAPTKDNLLVFYVEDSRMRTPDRASSVSARLDSANAPANTSFTWLGE